MRILERILVHTGTQAAKMVLPRRGG